MNGLPHIIVIGPLPPPMHGAAAVTGLIGARLAGCAHAVLLDIAPNTLRRGAAYHVTRIVRVLCAVSSLARFSVSGRADAVYISAAGGSGLLYNVLIAAVSRVLGRPVFVHHHSFAYADQWSWIMSLMVRVAGRDARHIFLCRQMVEAFARHYGADLKALVLSNAAFFETVSGSARDGPSDDGLVIGHLSNLCRDKGIDLVLEVMRNARTDASRLVVAGPASDTDSEHLLDQAAQEFGDRLDWRGPVDGPAKAAFLADIHVLLLPTRYAHEAEPLVVLEALQAGVPVIAYGRGCIPGMVSHSSGLVISPADDFIAAACGMIACWAKDSGAWLDASRAAMAVARTRQKNAVQEMSVVVDEMLSAAHG